MSDSFLTEFGRNFSVGAAGVVDLLASPVADTGLAATVDAYFETSNSSQSFGEKRDANIDAEYTKDESGNTGLVNAAKKTAEQVKSSLKIGGFAIGALLVVGLIGYGVIILKR